MAVLQPVSIKLTLKGDPEYYFGPDLSVIH